MASPEATPTRHVSVAVTTHGHYLVEPAAESPPRGLLVGFHGYGESAEDHLKALKGIPGREGWAVAAVQGLHHFYRRSTGDVVASWMTSFGREQAIDDNLAYVRRVLAGLRAELGSSLPVVLAGFSQGVAMTYRAAAKAAHLNGKPLAGLLVLAGDVPPELDRKTLAGLPPVLLGRGRADKWYDEAKMDADLQRLREAGVETRACVFDGGHEWTAEYYEAAGELLASVAGS